MEFLNSARYKVEKIGRQSLVLLAVSSPRSFLLLQKLFRRYLHGTTNSMIWLRFFQRRSMTLRFCFV